MSSPSPAAGGDFGQVRELPSIHQFLSSADRGDQGREVLVLRGTRAVAGRVREPLEAENPEEQSASRESRCRSLRCLVKRAAGAGTRTKSISVDCQGLSAGQSSESGSSDVSR